MSLLARLRARWWELSPWVRRPLRALRRRVSLFRHRARWSPSAAPRVVVPTRPDPAPAQPWPHPAIAVSLPNPRDPELRAQAQAWIATQTESSVWLVDPTDSDTADPDTTDSDTLGHRAPAMLLDFDPSWTRLPPTVLEAQLLTLATTGTAWTLGGLSTPSPGLEPNGVLHPTTEDGSLPCLLRAPSVTSTDSPVLGRAVPHLGSSLPEPPATVEGPGSPLASRAVGPWHLRGDVASPMVTAPWHDPGVVLGALPKLESRRPTLLFLLPFLAVGGAERLLFDLLPGLEDARIVVVTVEPHRAVLGQTVDRCRALTPHVLTLGDWLPRETHAATMLHLLRRYAVDTVVSWNGTVLFYDQVVTWRSAFPALRIVHQLYNHTGAWTDRCGPRLARVVDGHLAVNQATVEGLRARGMPSERIALVHHGVAVPPMPSPADRARRRRDARRELGLPEDAVVAGTFIRLHPQKRPLDILALADRCPSLHFLLVGGGPLDATVDGKLAERPRSNLTRLPLRDDLDTLYAAIDLCLMTSSYEGLPVFLLDGLARGLPCVATAVGEIPQLLEEGGGELVERPGDLDALAAALERLRDPVVRDEQGARGHRTVRDTFALDPYRERYRRLLLPEQTDG